ncbi:OsmC family protein [Maribacter hydrothermalis]|uniref:Osmotically inducible protein C n=1 Tax=Maribacter hydrothermalis TaxID=1836467 RepID=A0A1B7YXM7_9FLAO|nr:OsmC family protein [Maribacter hydrothermalis]APQ16800.1 osmotically inducible protein C [Maribacter hydrothermalis]OBR35229.1 osmotically inducible protein C [Maribacter hydrothermalis]
MKYSITANSISKQNATLQIKQSDIAFGTIAESSDTLPNPAELFLGSLAACILKNIERFSDFMNFEYTSAEIKISATRLEKPPRLDDINYVLIINSQDKNINLNLLKKNIEKFGTIFNTVLVSCSIDGKIEIIS